MRNSLADLEIVGRFVCLKRCDSFVGLKIGDRLID